MLVRAGLLLSVDETIKETIINTMSLSRESGDSLFQIGKSDEPINTPKRYKSARSTNRDLFDDGLGSISDITPLIDCTHSALIAEIDNSIQKKEV
jgi:hypothetical protein